MSQLIHFNPSALNKALVGFDQIFHDYELRQEQTTQSYPPYNVIKYDEDQYEVQIAVAGFSINEIDVTVENSTLIVKGIKTASSTQIEYLHKGLATRDFERVFTLGQYLEVSGASITNGLLIIKLTRNIPESMKLKKIAINVA